MKNLLGEDVQPRKITFVWMAPHLSVYLDDKWSALVSPNGWQGDVMDTRHSLGAPVMSNLQLCHTMSFDELQLMMTEWARRMTPQRSMHFVISAIAERKGMSFDAALQYVKDQKLPLYYSEGVVNPCTQ